ncbi:MAG: hypothetical protein WCS69_05250 [Ignavibacteriaceae bacterium]|jgi:hypothetical protein
MKKYINVKVKSYSNLLAKNKDAFILALQLTRLSNAIRSQMRIWRKIIIESENEDDIIKFKNRFDITLLLASILYESIKTYKKDIEIKILPCLVHETNRQKYFLYKERFDLKEFENNEFLRLLKTLRDKIVFHFDKGIITRTIDKIDFDEEEHLIAFGTSIQIKDMFFSITDDIVLNYLMDEFSSFFINNKVSAFYNKIENQITDESLKLAEYFDLLIGDLLTDNLFWTEEELSETNI